MSITITTGGITMTGGGVSFIAPPPTEATASWYGGGMNGSFIAMSTVCRITYTTDTATATTRGPLDSVRMNGTSVGTLSYGWTGGGNGGSPGFPIYNSVNRITYATDTATASTRGSLNAGWFAAGIYYAGAPTITTAQVERVTYATDTATASTRGPLSSARYRLGATGNTTDGWFGGGSNQSTVDRITYATDTATASVRGPLSIARQGLTASGNSTEGWFGGGYAGGVTKSTVDRITFATDTNTASVRGPLSFSLRSPSSSSGLQ